MTPRLAAVLLVAALVGYLAVRLLVPGVGPVTPLYVPRSTSTSGYPTPVR